MVRWSRLISSRVTGIAAGKSCVTFKSLSDEDFRSDATGGAPAGLRWRPARRGASRRVEEAARFVGRDDVTLIYEVVRRSQKMR